MGGSQTGAGVFRQYFGKSKSSSQETLRRCSAPVGLFSRRRCEKKTAEVMRNVISSYSLQPAFRSADPEAFVLSGHSPGNRYDSSEPAARRGGFVLSSRRRTSVGSSEDRGLRAISTCGTIQDTAQCDK